MKKVLSIIVLLIVMLSLSACGSDNGHWKLGGWGLVNGEPRPFTTEEKNSAGLEIDVDNGLVAMSICGEVYNGEIVYESDGDAKIEFDRDVYHGNICLGDTASLEEMKEKEKVRFSFFKVDIYLNVCSFSYEWEWEK